MELSGSAHPQRERPATWERAVHAGDRVARKPTTSTHLRQQQADLLHLLQRQQRVANRVLEQHVQQHLERESGRQRQRGPRVHLAPLPGQAPALALALVRTQAQTTAFSSPAPHNHSSPWRPLLARLAMRRAGSGAQHQAPEATPPRRRPIRGWGRYLSGCSEGSAGWYSLTWKAVEVARARAGWPFPASAAARAGAVAADARAGAGAGPCRPQDGLEKRFSG